MSNDKKQNKMEIKKQTNEVIYQCSVESIEITIKQALKDVDSHTMTMGMVKDRLNKIQRELELIKKYR